MKDLIFILFSILLLTSCRQSKKGSPRIKVILDTDMVEGFDDGVALMTLLGSDSIDVLGVTTVTGNTWAAEGMAYGIHQAEIAGPDNTAFIVGASHPFRAERLQTLANEIEAQPGENASWKGAIGYEEITDWRSCYSTKYGERPKLQATNTDASEYIANQILQNPGQITLIAIGPCTNIARALQKHPSIASLAKEIIYMGGAVKCKGNLTPYAEMNFLYDPEAAAICLRAPFPQQTLVSLDVCNTIQMDSTRYWSIYRSIHNQQLRETFQRQYLYDTFKENPQTQALIWDVIAAAITVDPSILLDYENLSVDVDDQPESATYGKSFVTDVPNRQTIRVVTKVDQPKLFDLIQTSVAKFK